jgi:LysM repeat protein
MQRLMWTLKTTATGTAAVGLILVGLLMPSHARAAVVQPNRLVVKGQFSLRNMVRKVTVPFSRFHPLTPRKYVVRAGDCLSAIAERFGLNWQELYAANEQVIGDDPNVITPGEVLTITGARQDDDPVVRYNRAAHHRRTYAAVADISGACHSDGPQDHEEGFLPENYRTIEDYLTEHDYTDYAAAGVAGNMWQESGGNPDAVGDGGAGLIGFTPFVAGKDGFIGNLMSQLEAVLAYNGGSGGARLIDAHASSPAAAAEYYMTAYERPAPGPGAGLSNRMASADAVAQTCGF